METVTHPLTDSKLRGDEKESAQSSKISEIINGRAADTSKMTDEPEDREVWSMEMGDDSVFYSDEEHAQWEKESDILAGFRTKRHKDPVNSVAEGETKQQMETYPGEKGSIYKGYSEIEKEMNQWAIWNEEDNQKSETLTTKRMHVSDPGESSTESYVTPEKFGKTSGEFLSENKTANVHQVKKEEAMTEANASDQHSFHLLNNDGYTELKGDTEFPQRSSETQKSNDMHPVGNVKAETVQNPGQGQLNSPSPKKSDCSAFNHLSSKYSTVSYRRIRRGNTRQRIEEFEFSSTNKK